MKVRSLLFGMLCAIFIVSCTKEEETLLPTNATFLIDDCGACINGEMSCSKDDGSEYTAYCRNL